MGELLDDIDRWQYRIVNIGAFNTAQRLGSALALCGAQGWELVAILDKASNWLANMEKGFVLFKRPVPPGDEPEGGWAEVWSAEQITAAYNEWKGST
jgi:hypothetical protein